MPSNPVWGPPTRTFDPSIEGVDDEDGGWRMQNPWKSPEQSLESTMRPLPSARSSEGGVERGGRPKPKTGMRGECQGREKPASGKAPGCFQPEWFQPEWFQPKWFQPKWFQPKCFQRERRPSQSMRSQRAWRTSECSAKRKPCSLAIRTCRRSITASTNSVTRPQSMHTIWSW